MTSEPARKYCIVPGCGNTYTKDRNKRFITVPKNEVRRKAWLRAVRTTTNYSKSSTLYVCEDHFILEDDAENWMKLKLFPYQNQHIIIKSGVVPHIFECQPDRSNAQPQKERPAALKRARRSLLQELLFSSKKVTPTSSSTITITSASTSTSQCITVCESTGSTGVVSYASNRRTSLPTQGKPDASQAGFSPEPFVDSSINVTPTKDLFPFPRKRAAAEALCLLGISNKQPWLNHLRPSCPPRKFVDKAVMARPSTRSKFIQCDVPLKKDLKDVSISPVKIVKKRALNDSITTDSSTEGSHSLSSAKVESSGNSSSEESIGENLNQAKTMQSNHVNLIKRDPLYYIGVTPAYFYIVDSLANSLKTDVVCVLICLQKIRLNQSFKGLSYNFGVSESFCTKTFSRLVPSLAECLAILILWPDEKTILSRLPIYFRARFSRVQSIIDCFEVEIEKPTDPICQTLTWSNYTKCNTLKYQISCTPDGYINHVSKGFGGKTSDVKITETCGYLDVLPDGVSVMTDRGFKGVTAILEKKKCHLVRPPSVSANQKSTKREVKLSKMIGSLRLHIERVIRRVREFNFLKPHACVHHSLVKYLDCVVTIVCGLVNLQEPIIKKFV